MEIKWGSKEEDDDLGWGEKRRSLKVKSTNKATLDEDGVVI